ncbi:MAG: hypothetical protein ACYTGO_19445, partial [Planctomycetota bacterium]
MSTPRPRAAPFLPRVRVLILTTGLVSLLALGSCGSNSSTSAGTNSTNSGKNPPAQPKPRTPLP